MKHAMICLLTLSLGVHVHAQDVPVSGPERLAWMRKQLRDTVAKFEFTQGYAFREAPERLRPFLDAIKTRGFNVWDQHPAGGIWDDEQFALLERSIQVAAKAGLDVWATLSPPSGTKEIARMPLEQRRRYYLVTVERFARLANKYPNFVAFSCDDFDYNFAFFSPDMMAEMARRYRAICPRLAFLPLLYYRGITKDFFATRGDFIDGIVFHFRADSYPYAYIPGYDPKNFDMYGDVMRYELKRIRQLAGQHPMICGIYVWYYQRGWGVLTSDEKNPEIAHIARDATQKLRIAHQYADGVRVYGLGIDHAAYLAMGKLLHHWQARREDWGPLRGDPESHLGRWQKALDNGPVIATVLDRDDGVGRDLVKASGWTRLELIRDFQAGKFDPTEAARRYPLLVVSKAKMSRPWPRLLRDYARAGGTLVLEFIPGWQLDTKTKPIQEGEKQTGDQGTLTRQLADLSGIRFHYERRGFATRWRVLKQHTLTEGLGKVGQWCPVPYEKGSSTYPYLVHPVTATDAEVLIEVEHEACPFQETGRAYVRQGKINGVYPLLTIKPVGKGFVIRHYVQNSPATVFADSYQRLLANLLKIVSRNHADKP